MSNCQVCNHSPLNHVISLGYMPPVNWMVPIDEPATEQTWLPTDLMHCPKCELVQLDYIADSKVVFPNHYPYTSGSTKILRDNFADLAREAKEQLELKPGDHILDIGSNDGTLLAEFQNLGMKVLGIEPTNIADIANNNGIPTLNAFFSQNLASEIAKEGKVDLITCTNCFAHIPNVHLVTRGIKKLLKPDGIFISENHYLIDLLNGLQYDTIYHEHLRYYSMASLVNLFDQHGLEIFHIKKIPPHGGSIRVYTRKTKSAPIDKENLGFYCEEKDHLRRDKLDLLESFKDRVLQSRRDLVSTVHRLKTQGRVVGIGAPSRASTVINYCRLDVDLIDYVAEKTGSLKIGHYMPGTRIPVVDEKRLFEEQPETAIIFSWHIAAEIEAKLRANGYKGQIVKPI